MNIEIGKQIELYDFKLNYSLSQILNYDKSTVLMLNEQYVRLTVMLTVTGVRRASIS